MSRITKLVNVLREEGPGGLLARANSRLGIIPRQGTPTGRTCLRPFYYASVHLDGRVYCCCPGWLKFPLGRVSADATIADLWNSRIAQTYRDAMLSTELDRVCKSDTCPYILHGGLPRLERGALQLDEASRTSVPADVADDERVLQAIREGRRTLDYLPLGLEIAADARCNLSCPSCRDKVITHVSDAENHLLDAIETSVRALGPALKHLHLLGSGEAFYSPFSLRLLRSLTRKVYPLLSVSILTNGQLLTERMWRSLGEGSSFINDVSVSIDAATPDTYETVRRGGTWAKLLTNLEFLRSLRRSGAVTRTSVNFVISASNFREMPEFVRLGQRFEMDRVVFTALQPWSGMGLEYRAAAVHLPSHPEHAEFRRIVDDPVCRAPMVTLGVETAL